MALNYLIVLISALYVSHYDRTVFANEAEDQANTNPPTDLEYVTEGHCDKSDIYDDVELFHVAKSNFEFTNALYGALSTKHDTNEIEKNGNIVFSPYSIQSAMGMLLLGCRSQTAKQIWEVVFPNSSVDVHHDFNILINRLTVGNQSFNLKNVTLNQANRLYIKDGFKLADSFMAKTKRCYKSTSVEIDFASDGVARKEINGWVERVTQNKIQNIIPKGFLDSNTRLVLVNAIYFLGTWASPFNKTYTFVDPFIVHDISNSENAVTQSIDVDMMYQMGYFEICDVKAMDARALRMNYTGGQLSMVFILPNNKHGLEEAHKNLKHFDFAACFERKPMRHTKEVHLFIPRFAVEKEYVLNDVLKQLGVIDVFNEQEADLSGISNDERLFVSAILQKAFLEVDEVGSEAAAATAVIATTISAKLEHTVFKCNHPFMFVIAENDFGSVLFAGHVTNPSIGSKITSPPATIKPPTPKTTLNTSTSKVTKPISTGRAALFQPYAFYIAAAMITKFQI